MMSTQGRPGLPTPPNSHRIVTVSTTFHPAFQEQLKGPVDVCLISNDYVHFYAHSHVLKPTTTNGLNGLLSPSPESESELQQMEIPEQSEVLNIILHTVYNLSTAAFSPTFHTLSSALTQMSRTYGMDLQTYTTTSSPLFNVLLSIAPQMPIELYALAASFHLEDLAKATSSHLLSYPLASLPDELGSQMGPLYLKRLFFLHLGRMDALRRVILKPPTPHLPLKSCPSESQFQLTETWAIAVANLVWNAGPDVSTRSIEFALENNDFECPQCESAFQDRVNDAVREWSLVKRTI